MSTELPEGERYKVKLEVFEGPLDLLLHLIQQNQIDIYNIPIALITQQYLERLATMERLNLEAAGEFFLMAATLMRIKARQLLPRPPEDQEQEEELVTQEQLVQRLVEYQRFKALAGELEGLESEAREVFTRGYRPTWSEPDPLAAQDVSLYDLMEAFYVVMQQATAPPPVHEVEPVTVSLEEQLAQLRRRLASGRRLAFTELFAGMVQKLELIITFIALLELVRLGEVSIEQPQPLGEFWLSPCAGA